jgi:cyclic beta-1,2-glucan synthetase
MMNIGSLFKKFPKIAAIVGTESQIQSPPLNHDDEPTNLRAGLFSAEQMEDHGRALAMAHVLSSRRSRDRLLARLNDNVLVLNDTCDLLTVAAKEKLQIAPAGEWLLDNFYLIEEQIRTARQHLPRGYSRELPRLAEGPSRCLPRVYDLALETISHSDGRVDIETLSRFVAAYQSITQLTLGELWAIPIMLRLALIENLRRVSARLSNARRHLNLAQDWANRMMEVAQTDPTSLILVIADMARSHPPMTSPFIAELVRRLQGHGPALALPLTWIAQRLGESHQTIEQMVLSENRQQASDQISVSNSIGGLRSLGAIDWRDFVEAMSMVEHILRQDPGGVYATMDFATRDRYRHVVARVAKNSHLLEADVAAAAVSLSQQHADAAPATAHRSHVGYYLIDRGLAQLEAKVVTKRRSMSSALRRGLARAALCVQLGAWLLLTLLISAALTQLLREAGVTGWTLFAMTALALLAASQLASALTNWMAALLTKPQLLPRLDFSRGLPEHCRTLVVVPTLISSVSGIDDLLEALHVRFLGNRDAHLHFALLTDFADAAAESMPEDAALLQHAEAAIAALNAIYPNQGPEYFFLLHRPRRWNSVDRVWMGFERKRGKLGELNALLRGTGADRFALIVGDIAALMQTRYVITLDTDTRMPRDAARQFVGTMAHPLNQPHFDERTQRITAGYGILQPRMAASMSGTSQSHYALLFGSEPGIDPYTRSASDVYQDLFGEGSFIGKGIYDVDAFESALKGRFPENRILSHDLLEGCYARSGLLSDVYLYEDYPARYDADVSRQQRWMRGDWQIARWLLPTVRNEQGRSVRNPISLLSRWKIFDNLRRSLVPPALVLLLLGGWWLLPQPWQWTACVLGIVLLPPLLSSLEALCRWPPRVTLRQHVTTVLRASGLQFAQVGFRVASLPFEAMCNVDAILRSHWRLLASHRKLLEWRVAASVGSDIEGWPGLRSSLRLMWIAPLLALLSALSLAIARPAALAPVSVILLLWLLAPAIAWWLSQPVIDPPAQLDADATRFLRRIARKTWGFFERFVGDSDHWLPPDNVQEQPGPIIAHRTSPTNIGLALLANLSAYDFGYISTGVLIKRTAKTFSTLVTLERHQGHFYNWYDTQTLLPLPPRYVSSVDSGNLAGHLLTLGAGLQTLPEQPVVGPGVFSGLTDALSILGDTLEPHGSDRDILGRLQYSLDLAVAAPPVTPADIFTLLQTLANDAALLDTRDVGSADGTASHWARALQRQCLDALDELRDLLPWLAAPTAPDGLIGVPLYSEMPSLRSLQRDSATWLSQIDLMLQQPRTVEQYDWLCEHRRLIALGAERATAQIKATEQLVRQSAELTKLDYAFLYDSERHLLAIGYNVDEFRRDTGFYDLLASEARLGSFVAIAQGKLPQESWFSLGRLQTATGKGPVLMSWSGSMFEYLMPLLVMPSYAGSLLDQTARAAVSMQISYGTQRTQPWGISESGYNTLDANLNYQYHAFGVPGLGFKRGLGNDSVVSPYASALALMVAPEAACANLQRLVAIGLEGPFGFYEAIDFTPSRLLRGQSGAIVRSFMAHHQGMVMLSLAQVVLGTHMQKRFTSVPEFQATLLLLQERVPKTSAIRSRHVADESSGFFDASEFESSVYAPLGAETPAPEVQLLSNGHYHVMLTNAGGGYSRWNDLALTRWREDSTCDHWGSFIYLRDIESGEFWSATHQPTVTAAQSYEAVFSEGRAEYRRHDLDIETHCDIVVSPEDDVELRRVRICNRSHRRRTIELTSYAEVVLTTAAADDMHPSFNKLFVQTEILTNRRAILCTRRPRSTGERTPWMFHLLATNGNTIEAVSYETDRMRFVGRGRSLRAPRALVESAALSGTAGAVLDPIVAIRCRVTLEAEQSASFDWVSGATEQREAALELIDKYQDRQLADRVIDLAHTHSGVTLRQINATEKDAQLYRRLAGPVIYANALLRAEPGILMQNKRGQSGLWGYAISGDLPIVLLKIADATHIELARQLIQCHAYWRLKGLTVDLVVWNEDHIGYRQQLQEQIIDLIATGKAANDIDRPGGIFVRFAEQISNEDRILLQAVARVVIDGSRGTLAEQVNRKGAVVQTVARLLVTLHPHESLASSEPALPDVMLGNALGGFSTDGREYVIQTSQAQRTPLPWVNVLANPSFGTVIAESGQAYTFGENAHEFRLTPWSDDPVGGTGGEAIYLRDEQSGHYWSPTAQPCGDGTPYLTRHGFGYSVFEHTSEGIHSELWVYVDLNDAVKFSVLKLHNRSGRRRRLSATGYVEWVLGDLRAKTAMHVVTELDPSSGTPFARNAYNSEFAKQVAFFDVDDGSHSVTGDRSEFLGRNGSLSKPGALRRARLSGKVGAALDPCGAVQVMFDLADGQRREIVFRLGVGRDRMHSRELAMRLREPGSASAALERVRAYWQRTLGAVQVSTPDTAVNVLANGWLLYQTLACRMWARSGYSQSGGAFGYRDQLQDAMALVHAEPRLLREQLLRCAARQFSEGDVQHWWHPPTGRGVRTRCSDDYLWLPLAMARYLRITADHGVLDEVTPFLQGRALNADEESYYDQPQPTADIATLYEHGVRAIEHGLRFGTHGLPLIGSGDWNDGMNQVGIEGKGESVWLGFFLYKVLTDFAPIAEARGDVSFSERCLASAEQLRRKLHEHAWDGAWYLRAWYDDGTPLGASASRECRIDSVAQSWSVLSGGGDLERSLQAMNAVDEHLVRRDSGLVQLLAPPFDGAANNPGYIQGYVPGVRENGGQYTHAAVWSAMAFAQLGDTERAWELLTLINPIQHAGSATAVATYQVEPYVVAADVYAVAPHTGRGGWTWYTGSAGWMYRLIVESLLGLQRQGSQLLITPRIPRSWETYSIEYRFGESRYSIVIVQTGIGKSEPTISVSLDGVKQNDSSVELIDDHQDHRIGVRIDHVATQTESHTSPATTGAAL